jgi:putative NADH-flavin reductase
MYQITVIGASAGVGLEAVKQALAKGNKVVALSRNSESFPLDTNLKIIKGSATNVDDVKKAIVNSNAVIVAIGTGASTKATTLYTDAATAIIKAFKESRTEKPIIVLTGFGAGDSAPYNSFIARIFFALLLKSVYKNKSEMEKMFTSSALNWEIVRPGQLTDKPFTGDYKQYNTLQKGMKIGSISRADVADFLVGQAENATQLKKFVSLTS